jgi:hypothetical protein
MRSPAKRVLALLTCLLAVAGSGDDFSLLRLVAPCNLAEAEDLPLDDPNTDFVQVTDSWAAQKSVKRSGGAGGQRGSGPAAASATPGIGPAFPGISVPGGRQPRTDLRTPLRCEDPLPNLSEPPVATTSAWAVRGP